MENAVIVKSKAFAVRVINLCKYLNSEKREYVLSNQLLRSGTSVGANAREASRAQSKADFISKLSIALKEADETCYWLELLKEADYLTDKQFDSIYNEAEEMVKLCVSIIKSTKDNQDNQ